MGAFGHATRSVVTSHAAYSGATGSMWRHVSQFPAFACYGDTRSHQGEWCDLVQYRAMIIGMTKRARTRKGAESLPPSLPPW
jgi:hypothetical protein